MHCLWQWLYHSKIASSGPAQVTSHTHISPTYKVNKQTNKKTSLSVSLSSYVWLVVVRGMSEFSLGTRLLFPSAWVLYHTLYWKHMDKHWSGIETRLDKHWSGNTTRHNCITFSYLALHMIANGYNGTLCELQQAYNLARHHIHRPLWHHAHALVLGGATVHVATLCKVR